MEPLLSIVTVVKDAASTIEATLASVALQKTNFATEHICVDGGSNDGTREIIDRWATRNSRLLRIYEPDAGIFDAMNKGLAAAVGEYVLFLNADDFLVSAGTLSLAMAGCSCDAADNPDLIAGDASLGEPERIGFWRRRRVPRSLCRLPGLGLYPVHQALFCKRQLLLAAGGFNARLRLAADTNLYYDMERRFRPKTRLLGAEVAFMLAGGAANAGLKAMYRGTLELYDHLSNEVGEAKAFGMILVKTLQSVSEVRFGRCPHDRWFASSI